MRAAWIAFLLAGCTGGPTMMNGGDGGGGDMALGPMDTVFTMAPFTVGAGQEVYKCQDFANPWGMDVDVREWESHMTAGSHHMLVFYKANATDGALEDCSGLEFASGPFGAQTPDAIVTYPDGIAALVKAGQGLRIVSHYLNATQQPINAAVKLIARRADSSTITQHAGIFFFNNTNFLIPADGQPHTISMTCTAPLDMNYLYATAHMHKHATNLTAMLNGNQIYTIDQWDNVPFQKYDPPLLVAKGSQLTFSCTFVNTGSAPLVFGESATANEMCIFDGQFYPSDGNDVLCN